MAAIRTPDGITHEVMAFGMPVFGDVALNLDSNNVLDLTDRVGEQKAVAMTVARTVTHFEGDVELLPNPDHQAV